jgi:hypothetical protein
MAEEQKPQRWWQTFPGILTATAGIITAVAGLVVALHQAGVLDRGTQPAPQAQNTTRTPLEATKPPIVPGTVPSATTPSSRGQASLYPLTLAAEAEVRLGSVTYKILAAQLDRYDMEKLTLRFAVRMTNNGPYDANFWDNSFRLLVDGVPRAPISRLNKIVYHHSAEEGDVVFVIPAATQSTVLRIRKGDESTEIPIDLLAKPELAEQKK